jgi:hypothetical protein
VILSDRLREALSNLSRKQAGDEVDWINIADAQLLTEAGLAERTRQGWRITPAGAAALHVDGAPEIAGDNDT